MVDSGCRKRVGVRCHHTSSWVRRVPGRGCDTRSGMESLGNQISQLATTVNRLEKNLRENVSEITLRSGKQLSPPTTLIDALTREDSSHSEPVEIGGPSPKPKQGVKFDFSLSLNSNVPKSSFPSRLARPKGSKVDKEILDTFRRMAINFPFLDAVKKIPKYTKFLK